MEYVIRDNSEEGIIPNFEGKTLSDTLRKDYGYLYESMKANGHDIYFDGYGLFF